MSASSNSRESHCSNHSCLPSAAPEGVHYCRKTGSAVGQGTSHPHCHLMPFLLTSSASSCLLALPVFNAALVTDAAVSTSVSAKQSPFQTPIPRHEWGKSREDERRLWRRKITERGNSKKMPGPSHNTDQSLDIRSAQEITCSCCGFVF